jgi:methyltransferase (TIGR00027 family)
MTVMPPVSRTAIGVARVRAAEVRRSDPLFDDPYAAAFIRASGIGSAATDSEAGTDDQRRWRAAIAFHISIRTRFFDDYLKAALGAGICQVVLLGAGLDARAFRLEPSPAVRWFELDLPDVLMFKQEVLDVQQASPGCRRTALAVDLGDDWADDLPSAGFDANAPTAWLAEGLLVYLDAATAEHVLDVATSLSSPGSRLAVERGDVARQISVMPGDARPDAASSLWRGGLGRNPAHWLVEHGWQTEEHEVADLATSYGRQAPPSARSGFVTATR